MNGTFENKLARIEYQINDKGSVRAEFERVNDLEYIGEVGRSKQFKLFFSTEGSYDYKNRELRLPFGLNMGFVIDGMKEKDFNFILKEVQTLATVEICNLKGLLYNVCTIDKTDYIKHKTRQYYINKEYGRIIADKIAEQYEQEEFIKKYNADHETAKYHNWYFDVIKTNNILYDLFKNKDIKIDGSILYYKGDQIYHSGYTEKLTCEFIQNKINNLEENKNKQEYVKKYFNCCYIDTYKSNNKYLYLTTDKKFEEGCRTIKAPKYKDIEIIIQCRTKRPYFTPFTFKNYIVNYDGRKYEPSAIPESIKEIKESPAPEFPEIVNAIKEPEPIKESQEVKSDDYILKTKIKQYNHIKDIIIKINKYTDKYLSLTGGCYYIKELIKQHKGKFYYNLPGLKNAWIIPRSEVRSLIAEIKN